MSKPNWGMINSGGTFESLMHALIFAEYPKAILFGRPGKDSGQDARSDDGEVIYQAKYYAGMDMAKAVSVALSELEKIKKYKQPDHPNFVHWRNAKRWVLVANILKNPNDKEKWNEVIAAFQKEGFHDAQYWGIEELEQLLYKHREILDVFFNGENRVFWGLHEAYEYLAVTSPGKKFIDVGLIGREEAMKRIVSFANGKNRILPLVGNHGSGLSRFLYEALVELSKNGWKTFWADAPSMAVSTQWFHLLNGNEPTCLVVDNLDDSKLTQRVIGQLIASERKNWKVIIACHKETSDSVLHPLASVNFTEEEIVLGPLSNEQAKELVKKCVPDLHSPIKSEELFSLTQGHPGWLCLLLETCPRNPQIIISKSFSEIVARVIESCVAKIKEELKFDARCVLQWLSAWGRIQVQERGTRIAEFDFIHDYAKTQHDIEDVLAELVKCGLVRNWGITKRCFAVEPAIFRQEILRDWLLKKDDDHTYVVSRKGQQFISDMTRGAIYNAGAVLRTLSNMAVSYLELDNAEAFLCPIFDEFAAAAKSGNTLVQYTIIDLLENVGWADPERTLEILKSIRTNPRESCKIENSVFGAMEFSHADVMSKAGSGLFQYAKCVRDFDVATRYLLEISEWCNAEGNGDFKLEWQNTCHDSLRKLILTPEGDRWYQKIAYNLVINNLKDIATNTFYRVLAEAILNPRRENVDARNYRILFSQGYIMPESPQWQRCVALRDKLFECLKLPETSEHVRQSWWRVLSKSHQAFSFAFGSGKLPNEYIQCYRDYVECELKSVLRVSTARGILSLSEFTSAREMWSWYLEYGLEARDPVALARQCESIPHEDSEWQLESLFKFGTRQQVQPTIDCVAQKLERTTAVECWYGFFDKVQRYLSTVRKGQEYLADGIRICELADCIASHNSPFENENVTVRYVESVLGGKRTGKYEREFALQWCKDVYCIVKKSNSDTSIDDALGRMLGFANSSSDVLMKIFADPDPYALGQLCSRELDVILDNVSLFSCRECSMILSGFVSVDCGRVQTELTAIWDSIVDAAELSACVLCFIRCFWLAVLRYDWAPGVIPMKWILNQILERRLDGNIFGHHETQELARRSGVRWGMKEFHSFIRTRLEIEKDGFPYAEYRSFPFEFNAIDWCVLDDIDSFYDICDITLSRRSYVTLYELPKCLAQLDPDAKHIADFVERHLENDQNYGADDLYLVANLVAMCQRETDGWVRVVTRVCQCCTNLSKKERYHVYVGFLPKMRSSSWTVGTVPQSVIDARDDAQTRLQAESPTSPLYPYREWVLRCAKEELRHAEAMAEEERHDGA